MAPGKRARPSPRDELATLKARSAKLEAQLREAEDTLDAIRGGHVDALVVQGPSGDQVFTLRGADHRYRQLVETMNEGALLVGRDGVIVYGNARVAQLVGVPLERLITSRLTDYVGEEWHRTLGAVLDGHDGEHAKAEVELVTATGARTPVYLSATASWEDDGQLTCVIVTDLSAQKRNQELIAAGRLASLIVEQAAESVVVCDVAGHVIRASNAAYRATAQNPLLQSFHAVFRLCDADGGEAARGILEATWRGTTISGRELTLHRADGSTAEVLLSAAPILSRDGETLGSVISFIDITERKRHAAERQGLLETAQNARAEAEAASRAKDEFLAMLGHELRNPLAPILTALELMRTHVVGVPHELEIIERQVKHVVTLVDDLLDVSRITQGKIELDRRPVELVRIIERAIELAGPIIEEREHRLDVDVAATGLWIAADQTRISQVISNLLVNAAKYTPRNGIVSLRAARSGSRGDIVIQVRDNGMGIPADILPRLFDRFVQGRRTIDRAEGGLGLGLAIVSSLVALHGGSVTARSDGIGLGSEFEVRLPGLDDDDERRSATDEPSGPAPEPAGESRRVLVVDDNVDAADLLAEALEHLGHATRVAYDGETALQIAAEFQPEIAVLDIGLPVMDGFELARRMRQESDSRTLHLVALTGYGQESDRRRTSESGFDHHLIKPVNVGALAQTIRELTDRTA